MYIPLLVQCIYANNITKQTLNDMFMAKKPLTKTQKTAYSQLNVTYV